MDFDWNTSLLVDERDRLADRVKMLESEKAELLRDNNRLRTCLSLAQAGADYLMREQAREDGES